MPHLWCHPYPRTVIACCDEPSRLRWRSCTLNASRLKKAPSNGVSYLSWTRQGVTKPNLQSWYHAQAAHNPHYLYYTSWQKVSVKVQSLIESEHVSLVYVCGGCVQRLSLGRQSWWEHFLCLLLSSSLIAKLLSMIALIIAWVKTCHSTLSCIKPCVAYVAYVAYVEQQYQQKQHHHVVFVAYVEQQQQQKQQHHVVFVVQYNYFIACCSIICYHKIIKKFF